MAHQSGLADSGGTNQPAVNAVSMPSVACHPRPKHAISSVSLLLSRSWPCTSHSCLGLIELASRTAAVVKPASYQCGSQNECCPPSSFPSKLQSQACTSCSYSLSILLHTFKSAVLSFVRFLRVLREAVLRRSSPLWSPILASTRSRLAGFW